MASALSTKKVNKILNTLLEDDDFITFFTGVLTFENLSSKNISFPDKLRESLNFRKYSLFHPFSSRNLSLIGLDELVGDNDCKIREIATQIKRHSLSPYVGIFFPYPKTVFENKDEDALAILAIKPNSDLAYFEIPSMNTDIVEYIRAVKNSDLPEESKLFAMDWSIIIGGIRVGGLLMGPKLTITDFEKILNAFRNELDVLYSIAGRLRSRVMQNKLTAHEFLKTDDPVISLLVSYIRNERTGERNVKECIEIFRMKKNDKNKRALFGLLHHFLNPFAR